MRRLLPLLVILAALLAACGKGEYISPADARLEARLANVLSTCSVGRVESEPSREAELESALKAAEHLPRVVKLRSDARARKRVKAALEKRGGSKQELERFYRLGAELYEDEKALGVHCLGRPPKLLQPRAIHRRRFLET